MADKCCSSNSHNDNDKQIEESCCESNQNVNDEQIGKSCCSSTSSTTSTLKTTNNSNNSSCSEESRQTSISLEDISANQIKMNLINFKCFIGYSGWIEQRNKI